MPIKKLTFTIFILILLLILFTGCSNKQQAQLMPKSDNKIKKHMAQEDKSNNDSLQQNYEFQREYIAKLLEKDLITKRQANYILERLNATKKYYEAIGDNLLKKDYEFQKDAIQKQLEKGFITKRQADYMLTRLNLMKEYYEENNAKFNNSFNMYSMPYNMMSPRMYSPMMEPHIMYNNQGVNPETSPHIGPNMMMR